MAELKKRRTRRASARTDDLDRMIVRRTAQNPEFPQMVQAALDRRRLLRALTAERERLQIPQQTVARSMKTSQPAVARIESGEVDVRLSTIERYAAAVGQRLSYQLAPARGARQVTAAG